MRVALGIGANLGQRDKNIEQALELLERALGRLEAKSRLIETPAMVLAEDRAEEMPKFLNSVALFQTRLSPHEILEEARNVERLLGRKREEEARRWQPRLIDVDILAIDQLVLSESDLQVPHAEMEKRDFVLRPFAEVWPEWIHPILKKNVAELLTELCTKREH